MHAGAAEAAPFFYGHGPARRRSWPQPALQPQPQDWPERQPQLGGQVQPQEQLLAPVRWMRWREQVQVMEDLLGEWMEGAAG